MTENYTSKNRISQLRDREEAVQVNIAILSVGNLGGLKTCFSIFISPSVEVNTCRFLIVFFVNKYLSNL